LYKGTRNSPITVNEIEPMPAKSKTCNSLNPFSSKKIEALKTEMIQIKYPYLENISCIIKNILL
jgi:hypothetical protein